VGHARKFIEVDGRWTDGVSDERGTLWAWGEWEPESDLLKTLDRPTQRFPHNLWRPYWVRKSNYLHLHNTDPFVFGGFYYTDCKQASSPSLEGLRHLDPGSVIIFGSAQRPFWVLDTVLVVRDHIDHDRDTYQDQLTGKVPDCYEDVVIHPTYTDPDKTTRRLYRGATVDDPFDGMFSFFPCRPAGGNVGFERPRIELPAEFFNAGLLQGAKGHSLNAEPVGAPTLKGLWQSIVEQILDQGLLLGTYAEVPPERATGW